MSTLQVANIWFESTANNRLQYTGSNGYVLVAGSSNTMSLNTSSLVISPGGTTVLSSNTTAVTTFGLLTNSTGAYVNVNMSTVNGTTNLVFGTGNTSAGKITIPSDGSAMFFQGGFLVNSYNLGVTTAAQIITPNSALGNYQYINANTAWQLQVPSTDCAIDLLVTNGTGAGTLTVNASYTANSTNIGDTYATTSTYKFLFMIRRINSISTYVIKALQ